MAVTLTPEQVAQLTSYGAFVKELRNDIAKAKRAGLNTDVLEQNLARIESVRTGMLKEFAPNPRSR